MGIEDRRFRVNVLRQRGTAHVIRRSGPRSHPRRLRLPSALSDIVMAKRGLILVTGETGSGKSTSLAAMIDHRNQHTRGHIITVEDPVEFIHTNKGCVVTQREVGTDTNSFSAALENTLRQAPDVILIGHIRDLATMEAAISFAEAGRRVAVADTGQSHRVIVGEEFLQSLRLLCAAGRAGGGGRLHVAGAIAQNPRRLAGNGILLGKSCSAVADLELAVNAAQL